MKTLKFASEIYWPIAQYSQQQSVSDLYVLTVAFLALKKWFFWKKKKSSPPNFFYLFSMHFFRADAKMFQKI